MNFERMNQAIAIIKDIPDDQLSLLYWQHEPEAENETFARDMAQTNCGTLACAAGWLSLHPAMQEQGLFADRDGEPIHLLGTKRRYGFNALAQFFDLLISEAEGLFGQRQEGEGGEEMTDKQVWLLRAENLIAQHKAQE
jgi:hypothetical protein